MNDYLKHYGILGMKWGVRRYQSKDGTLTPAGKKRYTTVRQATKNAKEATKESIRKMNESPEKHTLSQYNRAAKKARKESIKKDGTLTTAGRKRKKEENHPDYTEAHTKKKVKQMSSSELRERNTRLQMENQYSQLKMDQNLIIKGSSYVAKTATVLGTVVTLYAHSDKLVSLGKKFVGVMKKK